MNTTLTVRFKCYMAQIFNFIFSKFRIFYCSHVPSRKLMKWLKVTDWLIFCDASDIARCSIGSAVNPQ